ncbi:hypothetical protein D3C87_2142300 [compost metagenome]
MPEAFTKAASTTRITTVRTSVAMSASTPARPSLARMAVIAAKTADSMAQTNQFDDATKLMARSFRSR